jgi:hypothetical protein
MKTAVVTLSIPNHHNDRWMAAGLPSKQEYARRIGASFINITNLTLGGSVAMEKYRIGEMLEEFGRVFYLDADLVIDPDAPNIFDEVPSDHWGAYDEGRPALTAWVKEGWPDYSSPMYLNNGVFVCSKRHQWLFDYKTLNRKLNTYEQTHMHYRIWEALQKTPPNIKLYQLSQSWNYMPHLYIGGPAPGWIENTIPKPIWIYHYPCHRPEERATAMEELNKRFGLC